MDSQNIFPKAPAIVAAKKTCIRIETQREIEKQKLCRGHRMFFGLGDEISIEEFWEHLPQRARDRIEMYLEGQYMIAERVIAMADKSVGDTINLSSTEFSCIAEMWE